MLGRNRIKAIKSLEYKKFRSSANLFVAEGNKLVRELLDSDFAVELLIATSDHLIELKPFASSLTEIVEADETEIAKASFLKNPPHCIVVCRIPRYSLPENAAAENLVPALDNIQDPGNLGTIIRLADWFGITDIVCSPDSADVYNPKTVQATMGSIARVRVHYSDLPHFLEENRSREIPVYGTFLEGENIYTSRLTTFGIIVLGNEGRGIHKDILPFLSRKITIPGFFPGRKKSESLNISMAAAVILSEFRRREYC